MMLSYINLVLPNAVTDEVEYLEKPRWKHPIVCKWNDYIKLHYNGTRLYYKQCIIYQGYDI